MNHIVHHTQTYNVIILKQCNKVILLLTVVLQNLAVALMDAEQLDNSDYFVLS